MATFDVKCSKKDSDDADRRLDGLGGDSFYHDIDRVIRGIDINGDTYEVTVDGKTVKCKTATRNNTKYVTTEGDGFPPNNLLKLKDCP